MSNRQQVKSGDLHITAQHAISPPNVTKPHACLPSGAIVEDVVGPQADVDRYQRTYVRYSAEREGEVALCRSVGRQLQRF